MRLKKAHPSWGAPKIREKLRRLHSEISLPAISTVQAVLDRVWDNSAMESFFASLKKERIHRRMYSMR